MAQQDKTDWYWNGVLAGAVNNLYYDLINVDVCHVPYSTDHRNSSFFLKTRLGYQPEKNRDKALLQLSTDYDITDMHIIWDETCKNVSGKLYLLARYEEDGKTWRRLFTAPIEDGCIGDFDNLFHHDFRAKISGCGDWKLLVTDYVKGPSINDTDALDFSGDDHVSGGYTGIQINKIAGGITRGQFTDKNIEAGYAEWDANKIKKGMYLLVYESKNNEGSGFAGQVNMVTGISSDGKTIELYSPWLGFKTPTGGEPVEGRDLKYKFFSEWGEVVGFNDGKEISLITDYDNNTLTTVYTQEGTVDADKTNIIGVADANNKIFILTDNGYIHYAREGGGGWNKFFIQDSMFAGVDKIAIASYRDMILAFGRNHIAVGVPDEENKIWTIYNQSTSIGLRSRYSFTEYEGDLVLVSNDKRLLALEVASTGRYGLKMNNIGGAMMINGKLSALLEGDEVYLGSDKNNLKIFINTKSSPYKVSEVDVVINDVNNTLTHIYNFNTLFKVWTEDYITNFLLRGCKEGIYLGQYGIYIKGWSIGTDRYEDISSTRYAVPGRITPVTTKINAYLIENESDWTGATNSRLASRPKLYNLAKLNRLITTLGPGIYSNKSKIKVTSYSKGIGYTYEFPISGDGNDWIGLMTSYYLEESLDEEQREKIECMLSTLQDSQKQYQPDCPESKVMRQYMRQQRPWCNSYSELITESHGVCINDKIYELAPTMPLVTNLGENQDYCTQIKLELIGGSGDVICFGGRLAEMFVAPLFTTGPDGEYQLQPNTDCE